MRIPEPLLRSAVLVVVDRLLLTMEGSRFSQYHGISVDIEKAEPLNASDEHRRSYILLQSLRGMLPVVWRNGVMPFITVQEGLRLSSLQR